jgi:hypothetical protein
LFQNLKHYFPGWTFFKCPDEGKAVTVICNFKKRHTSKKQMIEAKKISRRELIKQGGLELTEQGLIKVDTFQKTTVDNKLL